MKDEMKKNATIHLMEIPKDDVMNAKESILKRTKVPLLLIR